MDKGEFVGQGRTAKLYAWGDTQVIKLFNADWPKDWIDREVEVAQIACQAHLPVPQIFEPIQEESRFGIIYERLDGPTLLKYTVEKPWEFIRMGEVFADLHLLLHRSKNKGFPCQRDLINGRIQDSQRLTEEQKKWLLALLAKQPLDDVVCHLDFNPENVMLTDRGPIVIDWMSATQGNSLADVAATVLALRVAEIPDNISLFEQGLLAFIRNKFVFVYLQRYFSQSNNTQSDLDAWYPIMASILLGCGFKPKEEEKLMTFIDGWG